MLDAIFRFSKDLFLYILKQKRQALPLDIEQTKRALEKEIMSDLERKGDIAFVMKSFARRLCKNFEKMFIAYS